MGKCRIMGDKSMGLKGLRTTCINVLPNSYQGRHNVKTVTLRLRDFTAGKVVTICGCIMLNK